MHETLLEAMKALSEEFRQRSKSQSNSGPGGGATASNPISVPSRRHHSNPPPSQVGFTRRPRTEPPGGANGGAGVSSANASPTPRHSFPRSRTASDGGKMEEGMVGAGQLPGPSSSPSTNGSCSTTPILRSKSARSASTTAAKTPLGLMRSISTPAPSPAPSLSSSSGHGSEFGGVTSSTSVGPSGAYSRVPSHHVTVSGSPSDYGSSDEYGSSPGDHTLLPSPSLPGSSVGSIGSQSLGEEGANYILMGQRSSSGGGGGSCSNQGTLTSSSLPAQGTTTCGSQPQTRRVLRRSSSRECEAERRLLSKRASLPPMALERLAPRQRRAEEPADDNSADYAIMSRSTSRESFTSTSSSTQRESVIGAGSAGGGGGYLDVAVEFKNEGGAGASGSADLGVDNGYMSMLPGVTQPPVSLAQSLAVSVPDSDSKPADDYMAMTPNNSVSPPQQIRLPPTSDGYMIMSPNSSCSPEQHGGLSGGAWVGSGSADSRAGSDYMNMSPISARSVNGSPPPPDHSNHLETISQHQAPKMVYSYYSLPRSYKHNPSAGHFDDGPGRGRRPNGSCSRGMGGGRAVGGHQEQSAAGNSMIGRHLSLSSSSYSSSSASSESLGESEERASQAVSTVAGGAQSKDGTKLQQRRGGSGALSKHGSHSRSRPVSLFVDVSKANTLPRVRENPLPPEPKSPGEYVSIEFKGEKCSQTGVGGGCSRGLRHGLSFPHGKHPQHRPASCLGNFMPLSRSPSAPITPPAASEYVNMDLGPSPSPSPLTPLLFPSFHTPPTPPSLAHAPKACDDVATGLHEEGAPVAEAPLQKSRESIPSVTESESPTSCGDYTEMDLSLNSNTVPRPTSSISPKAPSPTRTDSSVPVLSRGLDFPIAKTGPNPDHGAKVIRADPQGRRRHCSETFLAAPSVPTSTSSSSTASLFPEHAQAVARRLGFDSMLWGNGAVTDNPSQFALPGQQSLSTNSQTLSTEQGLNYIDLDLANKESSHLDMDGPSGLQAASRLFSVLGGGSGVGGVNTAVGSSSSSSSSLNTYASIDFYKSEELRTHQNGSKEGKGKLCLSVFINSLVFHCFAL